MPTLKDFPPAGPLVAQPDWTAGPCSQSQRSTEDEVRAFDYAWSVLEWLDPEGRDHEVIAFPHWDAGWTEEIFCRPGSECAAEVARLRDEMEVVRVGA